MTLMRKDPFARRQPFEPRAATRGGTVLLLTLMFLSVCLLVLSRVDHPALGVARRVAAETMAPALELAAVPAAYFSRLRRQVASYLDLFVEIERLKLENQQLKQWVWRAQQFEADVETYRKLLNGLKETNLGFATGRVIADSRGPFVRSVLVNLGRSHQLRNGYAVINGDGLVGRIIDTGQKVARVLLVNDLNSRLPVMVGPASRRAVLHGNNSPSPVLEFMGAGEPPGTGEAVYTSGSDGVLPKGLRIGTVLREGDAFRVQTAANLDGLEYVSVLFFDGPALDLAESNATGQGQPVLKAIGD